MLFSLRLTMFLMVHCLATAVVAFAPIRRTFAPIRTMVKQNYPHRQQGVAFARIRTIVQKQNQHSHQGEQRLSPLFAQIPRGFNVKTVRCGGGGGEGEEGEDWFQPHFPNPADFRFNYHNLLTLAIGKGIAQVNKGDGTKSVAIVGAGVAGMTAARELHRCGFHVTVFEASDRIGGRLFTLGNPDGFDKTAMELGAMRMPFFGDIYPNKDGYAKGVNNSALEYYLLTEPRAIHGNGTGAFLTPFPNPGQTPKTIVDGTGIYVNRGLGTNPEEKPFDKPQLIMWPDSDYPENEDLRAIQKVVDTFTNGWVDAVSQVYTIGDGKWEKAWNKIATFYDNMTFNELVIANAVDLKNIDITADDFDGNLGGMGATDAQAELLYTIGVGDGSWGAFYAIAALWFLRCTIFGFSLDLQTVEKYKGAETFPWFNSPDIMDDAGNRLPGPRYEGIQALVEYLFYVQPSVYVPSLYTSDKAKLYTKTSVQEIKRTKSGVEVTDSRGITKGFDYAIVTTTTEAAQLSMKFTNFTEQQLPQQKRTWGMTQHFISSCKLFYPLKTKFWKLPGNKIPQILVTDTYVQDSYGLEWRTKPADDAGIILASYTWEDDSNKFLPFQANELSDLVLSKLKEITTSTTGQDITEYVDKSKPVMFQWITQPTYIGCANLYRAYSLSNNRLDLAYNQNCGKDSHLFFCGENYGVEGGWTEPALRSALDAVIQVNQDLQSTFVEGFDVATMYPKWPADWDP